MSDQQDQRPGQHEEQGDEVEAHSKKHANAEPGDEARREDDEVEAHLKKH